MSYVLRNFEDGLAGPKFLSISTTGVFWWDYPDLDCIKPLTTLFTFDTEGDAEAWLMENLDMRVMGGSVGDGYVFLFD